MAKEYDRALEDLATGRASGGESSGTRRGAAADPSSHPSVAALFERYPDAVHHHEVAAGDEHVVFIAPDRNVEILSWLRDDPDHAYALLLDLTAVDYGGGRPLQVVYQLWSLDRGRMLRVKAELPLDGLEIDSVVRVWQAANWLEREVYDMFGIQFRDHPDLRRILMPANYAEGHPLRKDFPLRGRFTRAEQTRQALAGAVEDQYTLEELELMRRYRETDARAGGEDVTGKGPAGATEAS